VKPYFLLLLGFFVLKKAYRAIAAAALVLFSAVLMSAALFGVAPLWTFVASNPAARVPGYVYGEPMNQSLVGWLLRRTTGVLEGSLLQQPIYLGIAALLTLTTARIVRRAPSDHGLGLCLMTALLLYPATLAHYSLVILAPLLTLWRDRRNLPFGSAGVIALGAAVVAILGWDRFESHNFWANLSMWGAVALAGHHLSVRAGPLAVVSAPLESDTTRANPRVCPDAQGR
jgi:hypothetical protein